MQDQISIERVALLHPSASDTFTSFLNDAEQVTGLKWRISQGYRTFQEQQDIYNQGRTAPGKIVTWAKPGYSFHNYGLAIDIVPFKEDGTLDWNYDYKQLVDIAAKYGITCGINFPKGKTDDDHFEINFGNPIDFYLSLYQNKNFIPGTEYVNIE